MIDIASAIPTILTRTRKMSVGQGLDLRTYKRDRSVVIKKIETNTFEIQENGFEKNKFESDQKGLKKLLKTLLKREFPRSNKIRVYDITD
jgi:hypothetical protein